MFCLTLHAICPQHVVFSDNFISVKLFAYREIFNPYLFTLTRWRYVTLGEMKAELSPCGDINSSSWDWRDLLSVVRCHWCHVTKL